MAKKNKKTPEKIRLSAIFASFAILTVGTVSLIENMSLDYYSVLGTLHKVIPAGITLGGLGWIMGMILDRPKKSFSSGYNNLFLNNIMKNETNSINSNEKIAEEKENLSDEEI